MKRILITGMSGTGKSTILEHLAALGHKAVDLDDAWWCEETLVPVMDDPTGTVREPGQLWREDRVQWLLETEDAEALFIGGCESNQGTFYPQLDHVVLLTAPADVLLARIATRTINPYGKHPDERERIIEHIRTVEPLLRATADSELDTSVLSVDDVVARLIALTKP